MAKAKLPGYETVRSIQEILLSDESIGFFHSGDNIYDITYQLNAHRSKLKLVIIDYRLMDGFTCRDIISSLKKIKGRVVILTRDPENKFRFNNPEFGNFEVYVKNKEDSRTKFQRDMLALA